MSKTIPGTTIPADKFSPRRSEAIKIMAKHKPGHSYREVTEEMGRRMKMPRGLASKYYRWVVEHRAIPGFRPGKDMRVQKRA